MFFRFRALKTGRSRHFLRNYCIFNLFFQRNELLNLNIILKFLINPKIDHLGQHQLYFRHYPLRQPTNTFLELIFDLYFDLDSDCIVDLL